MLLSPGSYHHFYGNWELGVATIVNFMAAREARILKGFFLSTVSTTVYIVLYMIYVYAITITIGYF